MFKKREKPASARSRDEAGAGDGDSGGVPLVSKKPRIGAATASSSAMVGGEGSTGIIAASSKRTDSSHAAMLAARKDDTALSGFKANDEVTLKGRDDAVRRLEVDTEVGKDVRAMHERNQEIHKGLKDGTLETGIYRGLKGYKQYAERSEGAISASKYTGQLGPTRGTANVRSTLRIEYIGTSGDGGVCKDYKETGYCGFGDSCKFAHDRSDYKPSYILEKEWEEKQKAIEEKRRLRWEKRQKRIAQAAAAGVKIDEDDLTDESEVSSDGEQLPTECPNCDKRWEDCGSFPIQTVCGHYFCEDCALTNFAKTPKCITCDAPTNGIFNSADALEEKLKRKQARKQEKKNMRAQMKRTGAAPYNISLEK